MAGSVKKRYASKWLQRNGIDSTTASVPAGPSRSGTWPWRTVGARYTIAHSCSPKQFSRAGREAVARSRRAMNRTVSTRASRCSRVTVTPLTSAPVTAAVEVAFRRRAAERHAEPGCQIRSCRGRRR